MLRCAASFVVAAYPKVRLTPQDLRSLLKRQGPVRKFITKERPTGLPRITIDFQKIHFARQQGGDNTVVYLRPITQRNYFLKVYIKAFM